jgi:excisionase family DNA binding protein
MKKKTEIGAETDVIKLVAKMKADRKQGIINELLKSEIPELGQLREFWISQRLEIASGRFRSVDDEQKYQEAKEMGELITYVLKNYHVLKEKPVTSDVNAVLSVRNLSSYLGVSESIIRNLIKRDQIPYVKIEGQFKFYKPKIDEWLSQNSKVPEGTDSKTKAKQIFDRKFKNDMEK